MRSNAKIVAEGAALVALALGLSYMERMIPLGLLIPLPGVKLGLANIVTVLALYSLGGRTAFTVLILRCLLGSMFGGGVSALAFSLTGGLLAMAVMALASKARMFSVFGVSILGAAAHNAGQVLAAMALMKSPQVIAFLPPLLLVGLGAGFLTGGICAATLRALEHSGQLARIQARRKAG